MLILALDTTSRRGSICLARAEEIVETLMLEAPEGFGHILYPEIRALLERHDTSLADVDCYAAASGPGSFTGIRVGLSAAKSLAEVHGKGMVPVSNLLAIASSAEGSYRAPVLDARRGEVFAAVYDGQLRAVVPEVVTPWDEFLRLLGEKEITFVATDPELFSPSGPAPLDIASHPNWRTVTVSPALAEAVARLAARPCREVKVLPPDAVDANYLRRSDAELNWKDPP